MLSMVSDILETAYKILEFLGVIVSVVCCVSLATAKPSKNQQNLLLTCIFGLTATIGNVMEVCAMSPDAAMVAIKVAYIGKCYIITFVLMFVSGYNNVKLNKGFLHFLLLANTAVLATVMTCGQHTLYYRTIDYEIRPSGRAAMLLTPGLFYYIWVGLLLMGAGAYIIIAVREIRHGSRMARPRMWFIFFEVALPMVVSIAFLIMKPTYFDPATFVIMIVEICFLLEMKLYGLLETLELAQERIIEDTRDGVLVIDNTKSRVLYQNAAAEELIRKVTEVTGGFDLEQFTKSQENVYELDGRHYEFRVSEIMQSEKRAEIQGYVIWIFDMTFISEYTSEMIHLREEAEKANRAKTSFLANIAHEIRTPMNSIVGYSELALRNKDEHAINGYLKKIKQSSHVLTHLIDELIDITQIESGKMEINKENYSLPELIDEVRHMMEIQAGQAGLAFLVMLDGELPEYLYGDREKLQDIMVNLISNAVQYTHDGSVVLNVHLKEITDKGALINIRVDDTGIGINEEEGERIFAKFERGESGRFSDSCGPGLGLSIVKSFVDMLDGEITYESGYGMGTRFNVDVWQEIGFDAEKTASAAAQTGVCTQTGVCAQTGGLEQEREIENYAAEETPGGTAINSGRVLIVDDNDLNLEVASGIMELLGMMTKTACSGTECLELLEHGERPDIIFMDHMMPEPDGVETMKIIRGRSDGAEKIPIVLLTANAVAGVKEQMIQEGFDDFLSKPIEIDELSRILIRFLGEKGCQTGKTSL